jgi:hypothetical protein
MGRGGAWKGVEEANDSDRILVDLLLNNLYY